MGGEPETPQEGQCPDITAPSSPPTELGDRLTEGGGFLWAGSAPHAPPPGARPSGHFAKVDAKGPGKHARGHLKGTRHGKRKQKGGGPATSPAGSGVPRGAPPIVSTVRRRRGKQNTAATQMGGGSWLPGWFGPSSTVARPCPPAGSSSVSGKDRRRPGSLGFALGKRGKFIAPFAPTRARPGEAVLEG